MANKLISQTGSENATPAATSFLEGETAAGVSEHYLLSSVRTLFKTTYDTLYNLYVHPNHTGEVTSVADGATTIANNAVTLAKLATQAANSILAEITGATAVPTAVAVAASKFLARASTGNIAAKDITDFALTLLDDANAATALATLGAVPIAGGVTMTGKIVTSGSSEVAKTYAPATGAQTVALDCALNNIHEVTGHASGTAITFTVANAVNSQIFVVSILQGAVVSTITGWFATVRWCPNGTVPTLTATIGKRDTFIFIRTGAATYDGFVVGQNA